LALKTGKGYGRWDECIGASREATGGAKYGERKEKKVREKGRLGAKTKSRKMEKGATTSAAMHDIISR